MCPCSGTCTLSCNQRSDCSRSETHRDSTLGGTPSAWRVRDDTIRPACRDDYCGLAGHMEQPLRLFPLAKQSRIASCLVTGRPCSNTETRRTIAKGVNMILCYMSSLCKHRIWITQHVAQECHLCRSAPTTHKETAGRGPVKKRDQRQHGERKDVRCRDVV